MKLSSPLKWALKHNAKLLPLIHTHHQTALDSASTTGIVSTGFMIEFKFHNSVFLVCELTGRTCQVTALEQCISGDQRIDGDLANTWAVSQSLEFMSSLEALSTAHADVKESGKHGLALHLLSLDRVDTCSTVGEFRLRYKIIEQDLVVIMRQRKEYKPRQPKPKPKPKPDTAGDPDPDTDHDSINDDAANDDDDDDDDNDSVGSTKSLDDSLELSLEESALNELRGDTHEEDDVLDSGYISTTDKRVTADDVLDEQSKDMIDLDSINAAFVASIIEKQHFTGFGGDTDNNRPVSGIVYFN